MQRRTARPNFALWKPPRLDNEENHAAPSSQHWVLFEAAAHALYLGLVIGAHAVKNGMTKVPPR